VNAAASIGADDWWFFGTYEYAVDAQRRLAIPCSWRKKDSDQNHFFVLPGRGKSLSLVPAPMFQDLLQQLRRVSFADTEAMRAMASIGSMAQDCLCDKQGRIRLTDALLAHASIDGKAILIGSVATVQIWSPEVWEQSQMDSEAGLDVIQAIQERPDDLTQILKTGRS